MFWFWLLMVLLGIHGTNGDCSRFAFDTKCTSIDEEQLFASVKRDGKNLFTLTVDNSFLPHIEVLNPYDSGDALYTLTIRNSKIKTFFQMAPGIGGFINMQNLDLSFNDIDDLSFLRNVHNLRKIVISHNRIQNLNASDLETNQDLYSLDLSHNNIKKLTKLKNRRVFLLNLSHNKIDEIGDSLKELDLLNVDLSYNELSKLSLEDFDHLEDLKTLNLSHNKISSVSYVNSKLPADRLFARHVRTFEKENITIDLSYNKLGEISEIFKYMGSNYSLQSLFLGNNELENLNFLLNMNTKVNGDFLILRNNKIRNLLPHNFKTCSLIKLDLSFNEIESIVPSTFEGLTSQELCLDHNKIAYLNASVFDGISNLTRLNLAYNPITTMDGIFSKAFVKKISLDLSHCLLSKVPVGLKEKRFSEIYLNHNNIESIEPYTFYSLDILDLSYNKLVNLQDVFSDTKIGIVNISHNNLTSLDSVFYDSKIQNVTLTGISLNKLSQDDLMGLTKVEYLDLSNTGIKELSNNTFDESPALKNISLNDNSIQTLPSNLFGFNENLISLSIIRNPLSEISLDAFSHKMTLQYLFLTINGKILPSRFSNLILLKELHFIDSRITEIQKNSFKGLVSLKKLNFENSTVMKIEPGAFLGLGSLLDLDEQNLFANISVLKSKMFVGLEKLENLNLSGIGIDTIEDGAFFGLNNLTNLKLSHNKIGNLPKNAFAGLNSLKRLDLSNNNLTGRDPFPVGIFSNLSNLTHLHLQHNRIGSFQIGVFSNLSKLTFLDLSHNNVYYLSEMFLSPLKNLQVLDINSNGVIGFNYELLIENLPLLKTVGVGENKWGCENLMKMLKYFSKNSVDYKKKSILVFDAENADGIRCGSY